MTSNNTTENNTLDDQYYDIIKQPIYMIVLYTVAYSAVFICALVGNLMVVILVWRNRNMHSVTNYFIVNLAIADILVALLVLPMTLLTNLYRGWWFGWFMCKATPYLQGVSVCASVNTLTAIAVDRYFAICHTLAFKMTKKTCKIIVLCIWIASGILLIPWAVFYTMGVYKTKLQTLPMCFEKWPSERENRIYFLVAIFGACYSVPLTLIVICYSMIGFRVWRRHAPGVKNNSMGVVHTSKVKVVKMLVVVVTLFAFSWLPMYVIKLLSLFGAVGANNKKIVGEILMPLAQWLGSSNSGMNPIIYCFFSKKFRKGFKKVFICCNKRDFERGPLANQFTMTTYVNGTTRAQKRPAYLYDRKLGRQLSDSKAFV